MLFQTLKNANQRENLGWHFLFLMGKRGYIKNITKYLQTACKKGII